MSIKDWPEDQQPREKLIKNGAKSLTDAELLAIFLRTGVKGLSAVDLAAKLLNDFDDLNHLLAADQETFCQGHGLGMATYVQLQAILEMADRYFHTGLKKGAVFNSTDVAKRYLIQQLSQSPFEIFACIFLDNKHQMIEYEALFQGTINQSSVYPREVLRRVIKHNAAAIIIAHNHPSGHIEPSPSDEQITRKLVKVMDLIDTKILDHIIVGGGSTYSMMEHGFFE